MNKNDIIKQAMNIVRALTAMFEDSQIVVYRIDDMQVSRDAYGYYININTEKPKCD